MDARIKKLEADLWEVAALEISLYSVILEQALSLYMQPLVEGSCANKTIGKLLEPALGDKQSESFLIVRIKMAFKDAFQLLCPVRARAMSVIACQLLQAMVMEQCVARLDVAMFNAILCESKNEVATDPISDPIIDFKMKAYTSDEELNSPLTSTIEKLLSSPTIVAKEA
ncbi:hypothetical protein Goshw_028936 [Gossypium schwendimanii]|uniref:Uncharacterized protein n=1 Tax=Gossypium schwendimanii TaxID=34291 RepID=A0A7J9LSA4_GOSSC|nr:hypothetical protein [Gossypium schwendimanii]